MNKKRIIIILSIALLLIVLIMGKKQGWFGDSGDYKEVTFQKLSKMTIVETVSATGKIQPEIEVKISSEVSGEIIELAVVRGSTSLKRGICWLGLIQIYINLA